MFHPVRFKRFKEKYNNLRILTKEPKKFYDWYLQWRSFPVVDWISAAEHFKAKDFHSASKLYKKGLVRRKGHKASVCARFDYAYCLYRLGKSDEAVSELNIIISSKNSIRDAFILLSSIYLYKGDNASALEVLNRGRENFKGDVKLLCSYAHCLMNSNAKKIEFLDVKKELDEQRRALPLDSDGLNLVDAALARYEMIHGKQEIGDRLLARMLAAGAAPIELIILRGDRLIEKGRIQLGRDQYSRALEKSPQNPKPMLALAKSYLICGHEEPLKAVQLATAACTLSSWKDVEALKVLAEANRINGDCDGAELFDSRASSLCSIANLKLDSIENVVEEIEKLRELCYN